MQNFVEIGSKIFEKVTKKWRHYTLFLNPDRVNFKRSPKLEFLSNFERSFLVWYGTIKWSNDFIELYQMIEFYKMGISDFQILILTKKNIF